MNRLILIALLFTLLISCNHNSLFEKVDFNDGDKLMFKYLNSDFISSEEDYAFHKKYGHFYISDINTLNSLKGLIKEETKRPSENSGFVYMITLVGKGKNGFLGMYDLQKEVLFSDSYYTLRIEDLEKLSANFTQIEKCKIQFQTIPNLKKGIQLLIQNDFEIEYYEKIVKSGILDFNGMTTIKTTREAIPNIENFKAIKKKVNTDLISTDFEYKIVEASIDGDSVEIQIASNVSLEKLIPNNYVISKPYNETVELFPIEVYNIENVDMKVLFENNDIKYELIECK